MTENTVEEKISTVGIKNLLENVGLIQKKYNDLAEITGEKFNVFSIMNMEWDEVYTHSAMIGELLNPKGTHGQGSIFLDLFIEQLNNEFFLNEKNESGKRINKFSPLIKEKICERTISKSINWEEVTGGRIDIILEDDKQILLIENKPRASNQEYQLIRYKNYAKSKNKEYYVLYLTMNKAELGNENEKKNKKGEIIRGFNFPFNKKEGYDSVTPDNITHRCLYYPITFRKDILQWLELCLQEANDKPMLREVIKQYIYLIKKITGQTINKEMKTEIESLIIKNFEEAREIAINYEKTKNTIRNLIRNRVTELLKMELGSMYDVSHKGSKVEDKYSKIWVERVDREGNNVVFGIESFSGEGHKGSELFIGIYDKKSGWRGKEKFNNYEGHVIDLKGIGFLSFLGKNENTMIEISNNMATQIIDYIKSYEETVIEICEEIAVK